VHRLKAKDCRQLIHTKINAPVGVRYQIACATKWAQQFRDITIPKPDWYHAGNAQFIASDFVSHMHSMSDMVGSSVTPSSSGSGGGGFSGGGSGGGGGGSW
jgi:uncharacterized membrane protein YgcG